MRHKFAAGHEDAVMSKRLALLALDAPAVYDADTLAYQGAVAADISRLFEELGFRRLGQRISRWQT